MLLGFWTLCDFVDLIILSLGVVLCLVCGRELVGLLGCVLVFVCFWILVFCFGFNFGLVECCVLLVLDGLDVRFFGVWFGLDLGWWLLVVGLRCLFWILIVWLTCLLVLIWLLCCGFDICVSRLIFAFWGSLLCLFWFGCLICVLVLFNLFVLLSFGL